MKAASEQVGKPVSLLHFDTHLDTGNTYFDEPFTHGTPFRRAHEGLGHKPYAAHAFVEKVILSHKMPNPKKMDSLIPRSHSILDAMEVFILHPF